jgi:hypothetical protein
VGHRDRGGRTNGDSGGEKGGGGWGEASGELQAAFPGIFSVNPDTDIKDAVRSRCHVPAISQ